MPGNESKKHKRKLKKISVSVPDYVDKLTKFNRYCLQGRDPEKYYKGRHKGVRWTEDQYKEYLRKRQGGKVLVPRKRSKYNNRKTMVDGITFDSQKEADYYCALKLLKQAGEIRDFGLQPKYELQPAFEKGGKKYRPITYIADFVIVNNDGTTEVVDVKGVETQVFKIKKKMFEYQYPDLELKIVKEV